MQELNVDNINIVQTIVNTAITGCVMGIVGGFFALVWWKIRKSEEYVTRKEMKDELKSGLKNNELKNKVPSCDDCAPSQLGAQLNGQFDKLETTFKDGIAEVKQDVRDSEERLQKEMDKTHEFVTEVSNRVWDMKSNKKQGAGQ